LAEQAEHQCEALKVVERNPMAIVANPAIDAAAGSRLAAAARYQIFLEVLDEVSSLDFKPHTVEVTVT